MPKITRSAVARSRAIENRRTLLRCVNNGITAIVDPWGRLTAVNADPARPGVVRGRVELRADVTPFTRWHAWQRWGFAAAAAALCEPRLLARPEHARAVLHILDRITASLATAGERRTSEFQALRKGLGYCWSVAVVALPVEGKAFIEKWLAEPDPDVRWIMRENLKKARLSRLDAGWVRAASARLGTS